MARGTPGSRPAKTPQTNWEHCDAIPSLAEESRSYPRGGWNKHDRGGLFIRWPAFIGRGEFGRIAVDQMTRRAFGAAGFGPLLSTSPDLSHQQTPTGAGPGPREGADGSRASGETL